MPATLSLLGLYNWDSSVLDKLQLPASVDRTVFINNLLISCAELEILYPQPETLKFAVGAWSAERLPIWKRLEATTQYTYDPITNYDRTEEWEDDSTGERKDDSTEEWEDDQQYNSSDEISEEQTIERSASGNSSGTLSDTSESSGSSSGEQNRTESIDRKTAGFNSAESDVPDGQEERDVTENSTSSNTSSITRTGENSNTYQDSNRSETSGNTAQTVSSNTARSASGNTARTASDKRTSKRRGRAYGNIGVTTTQQMIREERDIVMFDLAEVIIGEFKSAFCLLIY